ncbi:MAG: dihydroorotase [Peptococcaceae bacterium]|nr:dihydroorotase [Peptococcaceae bacterium]
MKLLIKNGTVIDPATDKPFQADVLCVDGKIAKMAENISSRGVKTIDATGCLLFPGFIDMHVHLREPGFEYKETIASGTRAAARGGFTGVAAMPNTAPVADNAAVIRFILEKAAQSGSSRVYPIGAITKGSQGKELAPMAEMKKAGAVAFSDDGHPVTNAYLMRQAMEYARMLKVPIISHCEDTALAAGGVMNEGYTATVLGLKGIPSAAEEIMVARDILLAEMTGCALHIAHVSTAGSVRLIRDAKRRGVPVTAEVTPHHFTLTEEAVLGYNTNAKVNPPLRTEADIEALKEGLADGTIDVIATDHAPHATHEKDKEFDYAPFGILGLETAVGLIFSELVDKGVLTLNQVACKCALNPARILGLPEKKLQVGSDADITIIDPNRREIVDPKDFVSLSSNSPFNGFTLKGLPVATILDGRITMQDRVPVSTTN